MAEHRSTLNDRQSGGDAYARESFTFRRMKAWQVWAIAGVVLLFLFVAFAA
jgi:hypothetical protein